MPRAMQKSIMFGSKFKKRAHMQNVRDGAMGPRRDFIGALDDLVEFFRRQ